MPDQKLTEVTETTALTDADLAYVVQGGFSRRATLETLRRLIPHTPTAVFGDGQDSDSLTASLTCFVRVPYAGTIVEWSLVANASCTCVLDVWKAAGALPTNANTITASAKPGLTDETVGGSTTLTGWTTAISAGDVLGFELESLTGTPSEITLVLKVV
jgi:hypothetical protein